MAYLSADHRDVLVIEDRIPGDREYAKEYITRYIFSRPNRPLKCPECGNWMKGVSKDSATVQGYLEFIEDYDAHDNRHHIGCWHCEWYGTICDDTRLVFSG